MNVDDGDRERIAAFLLRMRSSGLSARDLLTAIEATPRRNFVPGQWHADAWSDRMVPIACGETIEGIDLQARALAALELQPGLRVLEVGTGSGYTAALMAQLAGRVLTVDRYKSLVEQAKQRFEALGLTNVIARQADGSNGLPAEGPFDRIIVWASFESLPRGFVDQLSTGGVMVAPIGPAEGVQTFAKLSKLGSRFEREDVAEVRLQPLVPSLAAAL
ncbi:protein-L-isoaspartate(D-aspartate) O-methyltransferase [Aquamicrobium sp. LC103]|uniref:protein-L-isoaspartate(D-aspartate) O-methyltransferase n=1 Tax=Aquamicrobium sp. LC103 TaxID=1120658 RepID=UPI00063EA4FC|nr:protein-L-isoaspartate(D-aspartate) O-methyltransferase [Aquamicrobium sp. LC103]TKT76773.1 protein-L-isoaspartate(D-aspartate) O-methyltransferase [Aquamicrobium sp. LC103]